MTIEEIKKLKRSTEKEITELLSGFRSETGLNVSDVELYAESMSGDHSVRLCVWL